MGYDQLRAIDLYAGIGGWSLGLRLAGVDVVQSYEWWQPAIDTHNANLGGELKPTDIRRLMLEDLPKDIDLVVGSPPCTEFSYANRGGSGDVAEGLKDLVKFFEVVEHLNPRFWAMENVPRVEKVIAVGMATRGHPLYRFRNLGGDVEVFDFSNYGAPQSRRRCIATNIPLDLVRDFSAKVPVRTLGDVVTALSATSEIVDPVWDVRLVASDLTETAAEPPLLGEELRMNREAKEHHPVYNNMAFPDAMDKPARTVTATCTRVSRESIVIADPRNAGDFRRLTIRERACLQGFPITYQFFARSFSEKAKMIGNAIPPTFTYLLATVAQGGDAAGFTGFGAAGSSLRLPAQKGPVTTPDGEGRTYPAKRGFRAALPGFRFKSGMRFDLSNEVTDTHAKWAVRFFFGPSKDIRQIELDGRVTDDLRLNSSFRDLIGGMGKDLRQVAQYLASTSPDGLQRAWTRKAGGPGPFQVTDMLAAIAEQLHSRLIAELDADGVEEVRSYIVMVAGDGNAPTKAVNHAKLRRYAVRILAGLIVGEWFNTLEWHFERRAAA